MPPQGLPPTISFWSIPLEDDSTMTEIERKKKLERLYGAALKLLCPPQLIILQTHVIDYSLWET